MSRIGLRTRLAVALCSVAVLGIALTTLFANQGVHPRLDEVARARLERSAGHMAEITAAVYQSEGGWTPAAVETLGHLAALDELTLVITRPGDADIVVAPLRGAEVAAREVRVDGAPVGTVRVTTPDGKLLSPEETDLLHSLDRLHLIAATVSVIAALAIALILAETLSRPLRRIRRTAEEIEHGNLDARVMLSGDAEMRAVGHALNRLAETLAQEERIRKQSVADLGHELRTPVHGLLSRIEAAQDGVVRDRQANLAAMHDEALRLTRLLEDLSRLTDAERPGLLVDKHPVDLASIAGSATARLAPRFEEAGLELSFDGTPVIVDGDPDRLGQIVDNLLSNARRYTERGGSVGVHVGRDEAAAVLEVADTGIGIAPDDLKHIYTRFWRGKRSRVRATGGTGIGLAIVHELVRAHEGRIVVESEVGSGTRFRVYLPVAPAGTGG
ncbi:MAG: HAMP domain-containing histidine kinase [Thermoleophilia bacterium]|nr:HAMP domain-containing histidine kinase [Thermoleophilia bacterium]